MFPPEASRKGREKRRMNRWLDLWMVQYPCHPAVALAIHRIAYGHREDPVVIFDNPTPNQIEQVKALVRHYVEMGDFEKSPNGRYLWGLEKITIG